MHVIAMKLENFRIMLRSVHSLRDLHTQLCRYQRLDVMKTSSWIPPDMGDWECVAVIRPCFVSVEMTRKYIYIHDT